MKSNLKTSILFIILMAVVIVASVKPVINSINYGLDLKGGFEVLYKVSPLNEDEELTDDMLTATYKSINNRIDTLGVSEPEISVEGDKIRVKLPGVTDESEARERLSTPAVLTFRNSSDELLMAADVLDSPGASFDYNETGRPVVALKIKDNDTFYHVTSAVSKSEDQLIVIWLDYDETKHSFESMKEECGTSNAACISSATVKEAFSSNVVIEGNFTKEEAQELVDLINSGSLPTKLEEVSTKTVDASFGSDTLRIAALAGVITLVIITIIMTIFYRLSGFVSSICLVFYSLLVLAMFNAIDGVLTLTGIAALILGVGMAIDSSIVTLEKIKDELVNGKKLDKAFTDANKRSLVSLIDANITTLIVAVILFVFGESSVKGFGSMLILTIIVTMITMILINRYILKGFIHLNTSVFIGKVRESKNRNFVKHSVKLLFVYLVVIIIAVVFAFVQKVNLGIDFAGGTSITLKSDNAIDESVIKEIISEYELNDYTTSSDEQVDIKIKEVLAEDEIKSLKQEFDEISVNSDISVISNVVKKDLTENAIKSVIIAAICILIYVSIRFKFNYGIASLVALCIDITSVIAAFIIFNIEINFIFIAAILTILGYSINDTIVIFDLIREKKKEENKASISDEVIVNECLSKAVIRSILTTITTLTSVVVLLILGATEIEEFNIAILVGLIVGTFTSMFIAPYVWIKLEKRDRLKPKEEYDDGPEEKSIKGINS